jgi:hypothetical protein
VFGVSISKPGNHLDLFCVAQAGGGESKPRLDAEQSPLLALSMQAALVSSLHDTRFFPFPPRLQQSPEFNHHKHCKIRRLQKHLIHQQTKQNHLSPNNYTLQIPTARKRSNNSKRKEIFVIDRRRREH